MSSLWINSALTLAIASSLAACGGGSGHSDQNATQSSQTDTSLPSPTSDSPATTDYIQQTPVDYSQLTDAMLAECIQDKGIHYAEQLQTLECSHNNILSIKGIGQFSQLRVLTLRSNQISDLTAATELKLLSYADFSHNQINSLNALTNLPVLHTLIADNNQIQSVDQLADFPALTRLYINDNQITDLQILTQLPRIKHLAANNNPGAIPQSLPENIVSYRI